MTSRTKSLAMIACLAIAALSVASTESARAAPPPVAVAPPIQAPAIQVAVGDTLVPIFSILKDTVLAVVSVKSSTGSRGAAAVKRCGLSSLQLRIFRRGVAVYSDTLRTIACSPAPTGLSCDSLTAVLKFDGSKGTTPEVQQLFTDCRSRVLPEAPLSG